MIADQPQQQRAASRNFQVAKGEFGASRFPFRRGRDVVAIHAWAGECCRKGRPQRTCTSALRLVREELPNEVVRDAGKPRRYHGIGGLSGRISLQLCPSFEHGTRRGTGSAAQINTIWQHVQRQHPRDFRHF